MLRFFRNIRQKLLKKGNIRKYSLYAIGEILLVVIGILIALQINNWNEENQLKAQEQVYLELIVDDLLLQKDENELQRKAIVGHVEIQEELSELIMNRFKVSKNEQYEVKQLLSTLLVGRTFGAYEATYFDLTSSGNIRLISDQILKNRIIQHYQIQKRDRDVINNNTLNTYLEIWTKLLDRNLIVISPDLARYATERNVLTFNPDYDFLDEQLFENLSDDNNLILMQNILNFKIASTRIATTFLDQSDDRIDRLIEDIKLLKQDL